MSDNSLLSLLSQKDNSISVSFFLITIITTTLCFLPCFLPLDHNHLILRPRNRHTVIEAFLLVSLGISISKVYEFFRERSVIKGLLHAKMPYRFGYFIIASVTSMGYFALFMTLELSNDAQGSISLECANSVVVVSSILSIMISTNPFPQPTHLLNTLLLLTFSASQILEVIALSIYNTDDDEARVYIIGSAILLAACLSLLTTFIYLKVHMLRKQYDSWSEMLTEQSINLTLASLTYIYLVVKLSVMIGLGAVGEYGNLFAVEVVFLAAFSFLVLHLPHQLICRELVNINDELESKHTYVSCIAHEIRSPLSTIIQGIDLLLKDISSGQRESIERHEVEEVLGYIKLSSEIATKTLNDLLSFDKIRSDRMQLEFQLTNALSFINHSLKPFHVQARAMGIIMKSRFEGFNADVVSIMIDKTKMEQVFRNFISNALKFSPRGSSVTIDVSVSDRFTSIPKLKQIAPNGVKGVFRVAVIDQGAGISMANQHKLFDKYVQINANKLQAGKGSGLGLWLSKAFVERHGGVIGMSSSGEGQGSTFYFELPYFESKMVIPSSTIAATTYQLLGRQGSVSRIADPIHDVAAEFAAELMTNNLRGYDNFEISTTRKRRQSFPAIRKQISRAESSKDPNLANEITIVSPDTGRYSGILTEYNTHDTMESSNSLPPRRTSAASTITSRLIGGSHELEVQQENAALHIDTGDLALFGPPRSTSFTGNLSTRSMMKSSRSSARIAPSLSPAAAYESEHHQVDYVDALPDLVQTFSLSGSASYQTTPMMTTSALTASAIESQSSIRPSVNKAPDSATSASGGAIGSKFFDLVSPLSMFSPASSNPSRRTNHSLKDSTKGIAMSATPSTVSSSNRTNRRHFELDMEGSWNILLVDDSEIVRKMVERILKRINPANRIDHAEDGSLAVDRVRENVELYDVVVMDYHMPKMDGIETSRVLRSLGFHGLIIGVTASGEQDDRAAFLSHGADEVLEKPLTIESFYDALRRFQSKHASSADNNTNNLNGNSS
jgi:signal transduction histidine kinase/CheY-like chemotaxis protein